MAATDPVQTSTQPTQPNPREGQSPMPPLGDHGEPCAECGAPLASDQRYCLNCGHRRGGPRLPFEGTLAAGSTSGDEGSRSRDVSPLSAVAGVALLGVLLLVGVLIGRGNGSSPTQAPAPVVQVGGAGADTPSGGGRSVNTSAGTVTSDWPAGKEGYTVELGTLPKQGTTADQVDAQKSALESKGATQVGVLDSDKYTSLPSGNYVLYSGVYTAKADATKALAKLKGKFPDAKVVQVSTKGSSGGGSAAAPGASGGGSLTGGGSGSSKGTVTASKADLKNLQNTSGQAYENAIKHIPDTIKTQGKPPPVDNKPAGAGSSTQTIK
jgi:hypothetical protein